MPGEIEETIPPTARELMGGIMADLHRLVDQQFHLTWLQIEEDSRLLKTACGILAAGFAVLSFGTLTGCFMLVHLLHWLTSPVNSDPSTLPLWACHALVALMLTVIGIALTLIGRSQLRSVHFRELSGIDPLPEHAS